MGSPRSPCGLAQDSLYVNDPVFVCPFSFAHRARACAHGLLCTLKKAARENVPAYAAFGARRKPYVDRANSMALMAIVWMKVRRLQRHQRH